MTEKKEPLSVAHDWLAEVAAALELPDSAATALTKELLDLTREVAHNRSRPGAPLTAFLVGLASANEEEARTNIAKIRDLI